MTRAFVTGGSGFVGANLVAGLNDRGIQAKVLLRKSSSTKALEGLDYEPVYGDILDPVDEIVQLVEGCDWMFHVAAVSDYWRVKKEKLYQVNVGGTKNMVEVALSAGIGRFVFTSSLAAMGVPAPGKLLDESDYFNLKPDQFPYGHSKYLAEIEVQKGVERGLPAVIVNQSISLGPRDIRMNSGSIVVEASNGLAKVVLPGGQNYVAIEDVVHGHIAAAEIGRVGERYILGGTNMSNAEAIRVVCEVVGCKPPTFKLRKWMLPPSATLVRLGRLLLGNRIPFDANQVRMLAVELYANNEKAVNELGLPITPFRNAVKKAFDWYNENGYLD
jgi:dihydroflavonol-4-reductase